MTCLLKMCYFLSHQIYEFGGMFSLVCGCFRGVTQSAVTAVSHTDKAEIIGKVIREDPVVQKICQKKGDEQGKEQ